MGLIYHTGKQPLCYNLIEKEQQEKEQQLNGGPSSYDLHKQRQHKRTRTICTYISDKFSCFSNLKKLKKRKEKIMKKDNMAFQQIKVVVWKNLIIRKRHWILTFFEALLPIVLFLLIAYGRSKITGLSKLEITEPTINDPYFVDYSSLGIGDTRLLYMPQTEFYQDIIKRTQEKLQMYTNNIKGFDSAEDLFKYYAKHSNDTVIAVIFKGKDTKHLDYTIRYHQQYGLFLRTGEKYNKNSQLRVDNQGTDYSWYGFLSLQKALDMSFIEKSYGEELEQNITVFIQQFPYPPHTEDSIAVMFITFLPLFTLFSFIFLCPALLKRIVEEKQSGIKELLKMVGMKSWMLWLGWFIYEIIPMLFAVIWIVILIKVPFFGAKYPPVEFSDGSVLFFFLLLYCMTAIVFCFALSTLFNRPTIAMVTAILIWTLSYFIPKYSLNLEESNNRLSWLLNMLLMLFPNMALHYGYSAISLYEERELGIQWNNIYKSGSDGADEVTLLNVFVMLVVDMVIYMLFTIYMDSVNPGKYGVRKPVLFPLKYLTNIVPTYWKRNNIDLDIESARLGYVENSKGLKKGIEIQNLCKRFGPKAAVNNLDLNIYQNQITVLLGHNGAGKSTTIAMITGMLEPTKGKIIMNGKDIKENMGEIRQTLGLCPQHNLLFTDLTVAEHLEFFARLRGQTAKEAKEEVGVLLKKLNLADKKNSLADTLSGGMKRKLCLGMALVGKSKILILDEPSSGMDPESRRELWDLLLSWRGEKTILITTHFMEEADVLGDWIAIMANGTMQCYGTSMFLKKKYETGYHLSLMVNGGAAEEEKETIKKNIISFNEGAKFKEANGNNMIFVLPFDNNMGVADLLFNLEEKKDELKIENIAITVTTLEDVFLKAKVESGMEEETDNVISSDSEVTPNRTKDLLKLRIWALIEKRYYFFLRKGMTYFIHVLIAFIFFILTVYLSREIQSNSGENGPQLKLQLTTYKQTTAFYNGTDNNPTIVDMKKFYKQLVEKDEGRAIEVKDVIQAILNKGIENILYYKNYMIASAEFKFTSNIEAIALYNAIAIHSSPISLNLVMNAFAKTYLGGEYSISISNWPLATVNTKVADQEFSEHKVALLYLILIPIGCLFVHGSFILFPHIELSTKFAQLQYMCGVRPCWYWTVNFLSDLVIYLVFIVPAVIMCVLPPFRGSHEIGTLFLILFMYGLAGIPFTYLFSRLKSASGAFAFFVIQGIFLGIIITTIIGVLLESGVDYYMDQGKILKRFFVFFLPQVGLTVSGVDFARKAVKNYNMDIMPKAKQLSICMYNENPCCSGDPSKCDEFKSYLPLLSQNFCLMFLSCLFYFSLNIFLDTYLYKKMLSRVKFVLKNRELPKCKSDEESKDEIKLYKAQNLYKTYSGEVIVKNIEFKLPQGECMGILGVNGAGKTTTFRLLTRDVVLDSGSVNISDENGDILNINNYEYLQKLGYCPQSDGLNFVLTGRQILSVIAQLRGIDDPKVVDGFLELFELKQYADVPCGYYSGGNKRKLSLAVALIGYPQYVLLDEPTNGVDPSSRRKFWTLIKRIQEKKKISFILTSHSMVECEALCNNLKIMKNGEFEKEGTISELKRKIGGFSIKLKLVNKELVSSKKEIAGSSLNLVACDEVDSVSLESEEEIPKSNNLDKYMSLKNEDDTPKFNNLDKLKKYLVDDYHGEIKDETSGLLHVYVKDSNKRWSNIFKEVENLKRRNSHLIEDYAISEASLEDVFLSVARSDDTPKKKKKGRNTNTI